MSDQQSAISYQLSAISYQLNKLSAISDQLEPSPKGSPHTKGTGSTVLRCVVFFGSPYGANPSTAGLWESAPKGARTGCPRLIFEAGCLVRSARAPKPEERRVGCAIRGGLSFGDFSLAAQRKVTCRGSATHKYTRPQAARLLHPHPHLP